MINATSQSLDPLVLHILPQFSHFILTQNIIFFDDKFNSFPKLIQESCKIDEKRLPWIYGTNKQTNWKWSTQQALAHFSHLLFLVTTQKFRIHILHSIIICSFFYFYKNQSLISDIYFFPPEDLEKLLSKVE